MFHFTLLIKKSHGAYHMDCILHCNAAFGCTATPRACPRELLGALLAGRDLFFGGMVLQGFTFVVLEPQMAVDDVFRAFAGVFPKGL